MRTLIIDNYDSFTWNLAHYVAEVNGEEPVVVANDAYCWDELLAEVGHFDNVIISPGPGSVENESDFHISRSVIARAAVPLLGVCLGHQGIAHGYGGEIRHAAEPVHGRSSRVWHHGDPLFRNIPSPFNVVRYHSLVAGSPLAKELSALAYTDDGQIMALRHRNKPQWGVQFHPESILTEYGHQLIRNFRDLTQEHNGRRVFASPGIQASKTTALQRRYVQWRRINLEHSNHMLNSEDVFVGLYANNTRSFWLDSALVEEGLSRFSFMGVPSTCHAKECTAGEPSDAVDTLHCRLQPSQARSFQRARNLLHALEQSLAVETQGGEGLPFEFHGGWVGFFGYEMKALCGADAAFENPNPDALWFKADRFIAFDHLHHSLYLVANSAQENDPELQQWFDQTSSQIAALSPCAAPQVKHSQRPLSMRWDQSRDEYLHSIAQCKAAIKEGISYEVCLTNQLRIDHKVEGLALYRELRRSNPAPFAAYLRLDDFEVISASPERFLSVDRSGMMEAKPIKGTTLRDAHPERDAELAETLRRSEKDRAENLMIVDLMRNDLGRVAVRGSVTVPRLMYIESYATVHQLLSTVCAKLKPECSLMDVINASFPGGSITGAPKLRTMQIIDQLERSARGVYCGSIGYLGYNRVADLNIAIRTITATPGGVSLGAGGAITQLSDASDEFAEIVLKARALVRAISNHVHGYEVDYLSAFLNVTEDAECALV
ncbi:MAG: aminodeoxychorismate synthase component I [Xanthomonadales bacterium]|nr:aminodeoxychorismate synthase component I [Xanthomonadales bacterium]